MQNAYSSFPQQPKTWISVLFWICQTCQTAFFNLSVDLQHFTRPILTEQNYKDGFIFILLCQAYILNWVRFYCLSWWPGPFLITIHLSSQDFLFIDFLWICLSVLTSHHLLFVRHFYLMKLKFKPFFPRHDIWQLYPVEIGAKSIFDVLFIVTRFPIPVCYYIWRLAKRGEIGNRLTRFSFQWSSWDEDNLVPESSFLWHLSMILSILHFLWHLSPNLINRDTFPQNFQTVLYAPEAPSCFVLSNRKVGKKGWICLGSPPPPFFSTIQEHRLVKRGEFVLASSLRKSSRFTANLQVLVMFGVEWIYSVVSFVKC